MTNLNSHDIIFIFSSDFKELLKKLEAAYDFKILECNPAPFISFTSKKAVLKTTLGLFFLKEKPLYCDDAKSRGVAAEFQYFLSQKLNFVPCIFKTVRGGYYVRWKKRTYFLTPHIDGRVYNGTNADVNETLAAIKLFQEAAANFSYRGGTVGRESWSVLDVVKLVHPMIKTEADKNTYLKLIRLVEKIKKEYDALADGQFIWSHGDFGIFNIIYKDGKVAALNDFDNVSYLPRIHDLAEFFVSATLINYIGPITNLRLPIFLSPEKEKAKIILSYYKNNFIFIEKAVNLFCITVNIIWLEMLLLAVLKEDYKIKDLKSAVAILWRDGNKKIMTEYLAKKKLFIWDFHDTLEIGTLDIITEVANILLRENGSSVKYTAEEMAALPSFSWETFFRRHFPNFSEDEINNISESAYDEKRFFYLTQKYSRANKNAKRILKTIKASGHLNIVISNSKQDKLAHYITHIGVKDFIDGCYGIDDGTILSPKDVVDKKISSAMRVLNECAHDEVYVVGDSQSDWKVARAISAKRFFWVLPNASTSAGASSFKEHGDMPMYITDLNEINVALD